jgi:hypothetical protein
VRGRAHPHYAVPNRSVVNDSALFMPPQGCRQAVDQVLLQNALRSQVLHKRLLEASVFAGILKHRP